MGMDMDKLLQQVGEMQGEMQKAQEELANETVQATAGGGMVTVIANGAGEIKEIKIDPKAIDPDDPEMLEDMVLAAVNEAVRSAHSLMESKMGGLAGGLGGLGLPGLGGYCATGWEHCRSSPTWTTRRSTGWPRQHRSSTRLPARP